MSHQERTAELRNLFNVSDVFRWNDIGSTTYHTLEQVRQNLIQLSDTKVCDAISDVVLDFAFHAFLLTQLLNHWIFSIAHQDGI